jgi:hypothetical protein
LTINDKCDGNITAEFVSRSDTKARDDNYPVGTTTVTWTFTDKSTNVTTCKQNITVKDITPPELDCGTVNSFTIPTNLNSCSVEASVVAGKITVPTAHDACDNADITLSAVHRYYRGLKGTDAPVLVTKVDGVTPAEWNTGEINFISQDIPISISYLRMRRAMPTPARKPFLWMTSMRHPSFAVPAAIHCILPQANVR